MSVSRWHAVRRSALRTGGVAMLVGLAVFVGLSLAAAIVLFLGVVAARQTTLSGSSIMAAPSWAFQGLVFRPTSGRADRTGWRPVALLVGKTSTIVVSTGPTAARSTLRNGQPTVLLSDAAGRSYALNPSDGGSAEIDYAVMGTGRRYGITAFGPLPAGATAVFATHNVPGGATTRIPINMAGLKSLPPPLHLNKTRVSGHVRVTLVRVIRGALLSEIDLQAQGFGDPGGEVATTTQGSVTTRTGRPPQAPATVTIRAAGGAGLAPDIGVGPVNRGVVTTSIGFKTPPPGTVVTLTIDNYILSDRPGYRGTTHGHWSFTFHMP